MRVVALPPPSMEGSMNDAAGWMEDGTVFACITVARERTGPSHAASWIFVVLGQSAIVNGPQKVSRLSEPDPRVSRFTSADDDVAAPGEL